VKTGYKEWSCSPKIEGDMKSGNQMGSVIQKFRGSMTSGSMEWTRNPEIRIGHEIWTRVNMTSGSQMESVIRKFGPEMTSGKSEGE
jgi:hypothetical protein